MLGAIITANGPDGTRRVQLGRASTGYATRSLTSIFSGRTTTTMVGYVLRIALMLGALAGLFGQAAALARLPDIAIQTHMAMTEDCMQQMARGQTGKPEMPCHGLTLDCISAMGCVVNVTLAEPVVLPMALSSVVLAAAAPRATHLSGRAVAPDLEPPTLS